MGSSTLAAPAPVREEMPSAAAAPSLVAAPKVSPRIWTASRIVTIGSLIVVPMLVVSVHPSPLFVGIATFVELALTGLALKLCVIE